MRKDHSAEIRPSELLGYVAEYEAETGLVVEIVLAVRSDKANGPYFEIDARACKPVIDNAPEAYHRCLRRWPTSTHKNLLAVFFGALLELYSQHEASETLKRLTPKA